MPAAAVAPGAAIQVLARYVSPETCNLFKGAPTRRNSSQAQHPAASYWQAGRTGEAITILGRVAADRARILGPGHPHAQAAAEALREWKSR